MTTMNGQEALSASGRRRPREEEIATDFDDAKIANLPRILFMGPRRGGKTSIQRVVFQEMSPHETLFRLEATQGLERRVVENTPLCCFTLWDFPGDFYGAEQQQHYLHNAIDISNPTNAAASSAIGDEGLIRNNINGPVEAAKLLFLGSTSLIFVMDAQDEPYDHVLQSFTNVVSRAIQVNPQITVEVFINKVDGELFLSDESKFDCRRDIMAQVSDELREVGVSPDSVYVRYHLTSIYDHSIYEALSRVVQRLIPQLPTLENLLNVLVSTCSMEKAYLFDVVSKLYISTDSSTVDMQSVELCSDMIDVVLDVSGIYGLGRTTATVGNDVVVDGMVATMSGVADDSLANCGGAVGGVGGDLGSAGVTTADYSQQVNDELLGTLVSQNRGVEMEDDVMIPGGAFDSESSSVIRLSNGMVLYLKEVDTMLALVCITRSENFRKKSLINYNIGCLRRALRALVGPTENGITHSSSI